MDTDQMIDVLSCLSGNDHLDEECQQACCAAVLLIEEQADELQRLRSAMAGVAEEVGNAYPTASATISSVVRSNGGPWK